MVPRWFQLMGAVSLVVVAAVIVGAVAWLAATLTGQHDLAHRLSPILRVLPILVVSTGLPFWWERRHAKVRLGRADEALKKWLSNLADPETS